jgi:hypothetical protein
LYQKIALRKTPDQDRDSALGFYYECKP